MTLPSLLDYQGHRWAYSLQTILAELGYDNPADFPEVLIQISKSPQTDLVSLGSVLGPIVIAVNSQSADRGHLLIPAKKYLSPILLINQDFFDLEAPLFTLVMSEWLWLIHLHQLYLNQIGTGQDRSSGIHQAFYIWACFKAQASAFELYHHSVKHQSPMLKIELEAVRSGFLQEIQDLPAQWTALKSLERTHIFLKLVQFLARNLAFKTWGESLINEVTRDRISANLNAAWLKLGDFLQQTHELTSMIPQRQTLDSIMRQLGPNLSNQNEPEPQESDAHKLSLEVSRLMLSNKYQNAIDSALKALEILNTQSDPRTLSYVLGNLYSCYLSLEEPQKAQAILERAITAAQAIDDYCGLGQLYLNQSLCFFLEPDKSLPLLHQALTAYRACQNTQDPNFHSGLTQCLQELVRQYFFKGDQDRARFYGAELERFTQGKQTQER